MTERVPVRAVGTRRYALVPVGRLTLEVFAQEADLHPVHVMRLVTLGLVDAESGPDGEPRFAPTQLAAVGRIRRLRSGLGLNHAAIGTVLHLLDRIDDLEAQLRRRPTPPMPSPAGRHTEEPAEGQAEGER